MPPRLTTEQKQTNSKAAALRAKAFNERRKAYEKELLKAEACVHQSDLGNKFEQQVTHFNQALAARKSAIEAINQKIEALKAELMLVEQEHGNVIENIKQSRDLARHAYFSARTEARQEVEARYPDLKNCSTPAGWMPLQDFIPKCAGQVCDE